MKSNSSETPNFESRITRLEDRVALEIRLVVLEEQFKATQDALEMQAKEYERRLDALNHEHARLVEERALTVSEEKFDGYAKEISTWRDTVNKTMNEIEGHTVGTGSARQLTFQILPLIISAGALILAVLLK